MSGYWSRKRVDRPVGSGYFRCAILERADTSDGITTCWPWRGPFDAKGYGASGVAGQDRAHRFAYRAVVGEVEDGFDVHHTCGNRACVNPEHLAVLTKEEHGRLSGPLSRSATTHCPQGHPYSGRNLMLTREGWRRCRTCRNRQKARAR